MRRVTGIGGAVGCALGLTLALVAARSAHAQVATVFGDQARDCYIAAKFGDLKGKGIEDCTGAMVSGMSNHDVGGLLVNRGVIQLGYERFTLAIDDFNDAIKRDPTIGDAFVNRGAAEIGLHKFDIGRDDIDHGLKLGADEPQKAYYNRGLADEYLGDETAAYHDYTKASEIDPQWIWPKHELARFTVTPK